MHPAKNDSKKAGGFALLALLLALLFWVFFDFSKHNPIFADINPFGSDPFDAVGSFCVLLAPLAAILALLGCFRPHPQGFTRTHLQLVLNRVGVSLMSVTVSLLVDVIALLRSPSTWSGSFAGWLLVGLLLILLPIVLLAGWRLAALLSSSGMVRVGQPFWSVILIILISGLALALFPAPWLNSKPGALFAVLFGMAFLFNSLHIIAHTWLKPLPEGQFEDILDDLLAVYQWKKALFSFAAGFFAWLEKLPGVPALASVFRWFNPRKHAARLLTLLGLVIGAALLVVEMLAEGLPALHILEIVTIIYTGFMTAGVLLGYRILNSFLGLIRRDPPSS